MENRSTAETDVETNVVALLSSLARKLPYLFVFVALIAVVTFTILGQVRPTYRAEATVLIETGESDFTRATQGGSEPTGAILDQEAISSQVQLIRSRDLAQTVSERLDLAGRAEFNPGTGERSTVTNLLARFGLADTLSTSPAAERVLKTYYKRLTVYTVDRSRVIGVSFKSYDPALAAAAANAIAEGYIGLQREAKRDTTAEAAGWLSAQIIDLRAMVVAAESKVETFRASNDLFTSGGQTPTTLPEQQLADLNAELARVRAERAEATAKAAQFRLGLKAGAAPNLTDVLDSQLIQRLVEQQVSLRSQLAQLSATLLPKHPRMKELGAQIGDLNRQIAAEARKILDSLESAAELAAAREDEIDRNLAELKTVAARANGAGVQLRALEREAAAQRDLLDSYLRRYREALAREQADFLPADARIISRAAAPIEPDFPKKIPMTAAATVAAMILAFAFVLLRELASGRPMRRVVVAGPMPLVAEAVPVDLHPRWADDRGVRRMMPSAPSLSPPLIDRVEEMIAAIAAEIMESGAKRILVTLADGCDANGRPLAAVALARVLVRSDARVVVVDFREDGENATSMGEAGDLPGFAELFDGEASFAQVIFRDRKSRVHFIPAGGEPLSPDRAAGERLETILSALTLTYDYVILDARDGMIASVGSETDVAVVVSEFGAADPRTKDAFARLEAVTDAGIQLLVIDSALADGDEGAGVPAGRAEEQSAAGEAA